MSNKRMDHEEDGDLARRMAEEEEGDVMRALSERGVYIHYVGDPLPEYGDGSGVTITFPIGRRHDLSKSAAETAARQWQELRQRYPKAQIILHIPGYGQDPREIWEFPDATRYVRWWAGFTGIRRFEQAAYELPLHHMSVVFLGLCGAFGENMQWAMEKVLKTEDAS
jgi:hypothetical protein